MGEISPVNGAYRTDYSLVNGTKISPVNNTDYSGTNATVDFFFWKRSY
jgi:hypothetical protein